MLAEIVPVLLLAPVAGMLADRFPPVRVLIAADLLRAVLAALLVVVDDRLWAVYAIAFGLAAGGVLFAPAANAVLPALVDERELVAANSAIWTAAVLAQVAVAPAAGLLYAVAGPAPAFALNAFSFLASAAVLARLRAPRAPLAPARGRLLADALAGAALLRTDRLLRALAAGQLLAALSAGATSALLVVLAREHLGLPPAGFGLLLGAIGLGALLGPLVLTRLVDDPRRPVFVFGPFALRGAVDVVLAAVAALPVALAALVTYGLSTSAGAVTFTSLLQAHPPAAVRARVFACFDLLWQLGRLVSVLGGGLLAAAVGIRAVYLLGGLLLLLAAAVGLRAARAQPRPDPP